MSIRLGNGNWAVSASKLLAYNDAAGPFFNKEFDFSRATIATRINKSGLIESVDNNIARINFSGSSDGNLILEPASTNLFTYSEDLTNNDWSHLSEITVTDSSELAPTGQLDANLVEYNGSGRSFIRQGLSIPSTTSSISVFAKKGNWRYIGLRNFEESSGPHSVFDFDTNTFVKVSSGQTASFESFDNGWYRLKVVNPSPLQSNALAGFGLTDATGNVLDPTGGQVANVHLFGCQVEENSFATSYIPTEGSTVTRNAELCNGSGAEQDFNSLEGVLYAEIAAIADDLSFKVISISDSSSDNEVLIRTFHTGADTYNARIRANGSTEVTMLNAVSDITQFNKIAIKYKSGESDFFVNGVKVVSSTNTFTFTSNLNQLRFEGGGSGGDFYGKVRDLRVFTKALTDAELITLTT